MCRSVNPNIYGNTPVHTLYYMGRCCNFSGQYIQTLSMATCQSIRYTMGRNGNVTVSPFKQYMGTCWSIRYTMGRNGNVLVSPFKHYVWQHARPSVIVLEEMAMCLSFHPRIIRQYASPYVILWAEMAMCWSVYPNIMYGIMPSIRYIRELSFYEQMDSGTVIRYQDQSAHAPPTHIFVRGKFWNGIWPFFCRCRSTTDGTGPTPNRAKEPIRALIDDGTATMRWLFVNLCCAARTSFCEMPSKMTKDE